MDEVFNNIASTARGFAGVNEVVDNVKFVVDPIIATTESLLVASESLDTPAHEFGVKVAVNAASIFGRTPKARMPMLSEMANLSDLYGAYSVYPMRLDLAFLTLVLLPLSSISRSKYKRTAIKSFGILVFTSMAFPQQLFFLVHLAAARLKGNLAPQAPRELPVVVHAKNFVDSLPNLAKPVEPQRPANTNSTIILASIAGFSILSTLLFRPDV